MDPDRRKLLSRGVSRDMSPAAISRRFDILVQLDELARSLAKAKHLGKTEAPKNRRRETL